MGYNNINCLNLKRNNCPFFVDRFFCPENCDGFIAKEEEKKDVKMEIETERSFIRKNKIKE